MFLSPTYRLLWGIPGRSNALTIAQRLGLSPEIVAKKLLAHLSENNLIYDHQYGFLPGRSITAPNSRQPEKGNQGSKKSAAVVQASGLQKVGNHSKSSDGLTASR